MPLILRNGDYKKVWFIRSQGSHCNLSQPHLKIIKSYIKTLIPNFTNILITIVEHITFTYLKKSQTFLLWWLNLISLCNNKKLLPSYAYFRAFISVRCPHYFKENVQNTELHFFSLLSFQFTFILCILKYSAGTALIHCERTGHWVPLQPSFPVLSSYFSESGCVCSTAFGYIIIVLIPASVFCFLFYLALNWQQQEWCGVRQRPFQLCLEQWS